MALQTFSLFLAFSLAFAGLAKKKCTTGTEISVSVICRDIQQSVCISYIEGVARVFLYVTASPSEKIDICEFDGKLSFSSIRVSLL